ncbi:MAG: hypothetical protein ACYDEZ_03540 [Methanoregula sp.]|jgi:hypothetical protein
MATVQNISHIEPLPRYIRPDNAIPEYEEILGELHEYQRSHIGSSYYYIRAENDWTGLCRILPGGGKIYFHEIVDHGKYGITEDELEEAVSIGKGSFSMAGYHPISQHIETKLRGVLDGQ